MSLWGPVVAYMAVIFALSSMTRVAELPGGMTDKWAHFLEYAGLATLTTRALAGGRWAEVRVPAVLGTLLIAVIYAFSDEIHQLFVPGREFDLRDIAADAIGAFVAAVAAWTWGIIRRFSGIHAGRS
jgi:VanZ family protein